MPTPKAFNNEPHATVVDRAAAISGDEEEAHQKDDNSAVGPQFDMWANPKQKKIFLIRSFLIPRRYQSISIKVDVRIRPKWVHLNLLSSMVVSR